MTAQVELPPNHSPDYTLYTDGTTWFARNNHTHNTDFQNADFASVFNQCSASLTAYGLIFTHTIAGATCYYAFPPELTIGTPTGGGSVDAGDHFYAVSAVSAGGESICGFENGVTIGANKTVPLTNIPVGPAGTTARKVYRTISTVQGSLGPGPLLTDGRIPDLSEYYLVTTLANNSSTTYTDTASDASIATNPNAAASFAPSFNDGGAIDMGRPPASVSVNGRQHAVGLSQSLQMYAQQSFYGHGRGWQFFSTSSAAQQYGTLSGNILSTDASILVNETTTPPATPFPIGVKFSSTGAETMMVTSRTLVSGSTFSYNVVRGWGVPAQAGTAGTAVVGSITGRASIGAAIDMYHADRIRLEGIAFDGQNVVNFGGIHKRTQTTSTGGTGGNAATSYVVYNEFTGSLGPEFSVGAPNDVSATSNVWLMFNRINGKDSTGLGVNLGDGHIKFNNISGGTPPAINNGSSITWLGNHIANTNGTFGDVYILSGQQMHFIGNYMDHVSNGGAGGGGAFMRPPGLSNLNQNIQFIGNRYSCSTVTDGLTNIFNFQSPSNKILITGEYFHGGNASALNMFYNNGGTGWQIANCQSAFTPATIFGGTAPAMIGQNGFNAKLTTNVLALSTTGNGSATTFTIAHNLVGTPTIVTMAANTQAAAATNWWTADATNVTVNFAAAPAPAASIKITIFCSV